MLFNSPDFLFEFLPLVLAAFWLARRWGGGRALIGVLLLGSLVFYGDWNWRHLPLLCASIAANFACSAALLRTAAPRARRALLAAGVAANLGLLFWFKYAVFAAGVVARASGWPVALEGIVLPIGISFYTFQQIAYLVDVFRGETADRSLLRYALFVSFFPQLIAGPIVHHRELTSQLPHLRRRPLLPDLAVGLTLFTIGLAKKVVLADSFARGASPVFDAAAAGVAPGALTAWLAVFSYGLQIYFDFSGYSDMALGLGRMFGIALPINFASPYKARSIVDFWRRWHVTLSRFLRDYLYIPLGGNRRGPRRRLVNVMITMVLGGIWHGAGWTFVLWGALHGALLVASQAWAMARMPRVPGAIARPATLLAVMLAWVPFRAADLGATWTMYGALVGVHGAGADAPPSVLGGAAAALALRAPGVAWEALFAIGVVAVGLAIVTLAPNTQTLLRRYAPGLPSPGYETGIEEARGRPAADTAAGRRPGRAAAASAPPAASLTAPAWRPDLRAAILTGVLFAVCVTLLNRASEFIYFQF